MKKYLYQYNEIKGLSIGELIFEIEANGGKRINQLTIGDLIFHDGQPIHTGCGVYVFKKEGKIFYVGKNSRRSFVERIPSHFDIRTNGWFNRLLRIVAKQDADGSQDTDEGLQKAAIQVIDSFEVILINFAWSDFEGDSSIEILEDLLRMTTGAANAFRKKRYGNFEDKIQDFIGREKSRKT